ncbi:TrkA family potassium uptake protein [uncultured Clostridium sp.]|uniref:potassium channel family protein n=1 Tax=uncultured Clostridium sp. TaxID=59620 RepID=UPI0026EABE17|nr:TrkA family potassium uptake protein [uncultured Clostridium sp.]
MNKQCVIVGLGKYGISIARKLSDSGVEVLALDNDMKMVEKVSNYVTKAICIDVTSEEAWQRLPIKNFDIGVVCFGENVTASILSCLALQDAGVKYIIAKAGDKMHKQVLEKISVNEVVFPEEFVGELTAKKILEME